MNFFRAAGTQRYKSGWNFFSPECDDHDEVNKSPANALLFHYDKLPLKAKYTFGFGVCDCFNSI